MTVSPRADAGLGRLLAVVPRLPSGAGDRALSRLLSELSRRWAVDVLPAGPSAVEQAALRALGGRAALAPRSEGALLARCREAVGARDYAAVVLVDDASTRAALEPLKSFGRKPLVLVALGRAEGLERPRAALAGDGFSARRRAREAAARQACAADEIWSFGGAVSAQGRFLSRPTSDEAWMTRRLLAFGRPRPPRGLATIIVPCFNGLAYTKECLQAVAAHTKTPHEVLVVDNGSTDGTAAWAKRAGARVIRNEENRGFAQAINQGMRAAKGRYLVWLNNDVVVTPGWLERLIDCVDRAPWIAAAGPCTNETVGFQRVDAPAFKQARDLLLFSQAWALKHADRVEGVHRLTGFCLLLKREVVEKAGYLDERFGVGTYEEFDYCLRLRQAGYDLAVARDVFVLHHGHKTFKSFDAMAERARINREIFLDKWCHQALGFLDELNPEAAA